MSILIYISVAFVLLTSIIGGIGIPLAYSYPLIKYIIIANCNLYTLYMFCTFAMIMYLCVCIKRYKTN